MEREWMRLVEFVYMMVPRSGWHHLGQHGVPGDGGTWEEVKLKWRGTGRCSSLCGCDRC